MTPRKSENSDLSPPVLSRRIGDLERRVDNLETADKEREDSNAGIRRELADHRVEDAKTYSELKAAIGEVEARLGSMKWMLIILIGIGVVNGLALLIKSLR